VTRTGAPQSDWIVFNTPGYTLIADGHRVQVWWLAGQGQLMDGRVLPDETIAVGRRSETAFDRYPYSRFALDGTRLGEWSTVGFPVDQHDLEVLPDGNLLLMAYVPREHVDLTAIGGPADAPVVDGLLQEVTPDRQVVWSWRSSDHVAVDETTFPLDEIELPDGDGVIISARHLDAVPRIRRSDGGIDWRLGGARRPESLASAGDFAGSTRRARWPTARSRCTTTARARAAAAGAAPSSPSWRRTARRCSRCGSPRASPTAPIPSPPRCCRARGCAPGWTRSLRARRRRACGP
jgi:hypothetical protein